MKRWTGFIGIFYLIVLTACPPGCPFGIGGDRQIYCASEDRSLLQIDNFQLSFRSSRDSIFYSEGEDSLRIYYEARRISGVTLDLRLRALDSVTFEVDTVNSLVLFNNSDLIDQLDTFSIEKASIITDEYLPANCCQEIGCWLNTPDQMKASILGLIRLGSTTRAMYFDIDIVTRKKESREC